MNRYHVACFEPHPLIERWEKACSPYVQAITICRIAHPRDNMSAENMERWRYELEREIHETLTNAREDFAVQKLAWREFLPVFCIVKWFFKGREPNEKRIRKKVQPLVDKAREVFDSISETRIKFIKLKRKEETTHMNMIFTTNKEHDNDN